MTTIALTRRALLSGASVTALAGALPIIASAARPADPLIELDRQWHERRAREAANSAAFSAALDNTLPLDLQDKAHGGPWSFPGDMPPDVFARYNAFCERAGAKRFDAIGEMICDEIDEVEEAIIACPARTVAGLVVKLRLLRFLQFEGQPAPTLADAYTFAGYLTERLIATAWADAERLSGEST